MKLLNTLLSVVLMSLCINTYAETLTTKITSVHDGDTVTFLDENNEEVTGRLANIDAPEIQQEYGLQSRDFLRFLILNETVNVQIEDVGRYGRYIITIFKDNKNINKLLIEKGYAWEYLSNDNEFKELQLKAENEKINIWSNSKSIHPAAFRKLRFTRYQIHLTTHSNPQCRTRNFKTCGEFSTCSEVNFWFKTCGHKYLDGNNNGIACMSICK